ncbi:hypothetical protein B484DRAFT_396450 [Ochromonadaceae sp. CCMP2298]|nr:hypothetical protein B484DRAFT_396450 [Ochromonadaceae sp. CCMP2298]
MVNPPPATTALLLPATTITYEKHLQLYRRFVGIPVEGHIRPEHLTDLHMSEFLRAFFRVYKKDEGVRLCLLKAVMHTLRQALLRAMLPGLPNTILYPHTTTLYTCLKYDAL